MGNILTAHVQEKGVAHFALGQGGVVRPASQVLTVVSRADGKGDRAQGRVGGPGHGVLHLREPFAAFEPRDLSERPGPRGQAAELDLIAGSQWPDEGGDFDFRWLHWNQIETSESFTPYAWSMRNT